MHSKQTRGGETEQTERLLRRREVEALTGLKTTALYGLMKTGDLPRPVRIGSRAVRWRLSAVTAWIAALPVASIEPTENQ